MIIILPRVKREAQGILVNLPPRAKREFQGIIVDLPPQAKRETQGIIVNLPPRPKREAQLVLVNRFFRPKPEMRERVKKNLFSGLSGFDYVDLIQKMSDICLLMKKTVKVLIGNAWAKQ